MGHAALEIQNPRAFTLMRDRAEPLEVFAFRMHWTCQVVRRTRAELFRAHFLLLHGFVLALPATW
jgi:hypothetical protein